jgi:GT2 family glycosyltransferase
LKFSVIIPTCSRHEQLFDALGRLAHYLNAEQQQQPSFDVEVIVADDAVDSNLGPLLTLNFPRCVYVEGPHRGPAACRNKGAAAASGDWLVFLDDDCIPEPGWIEAYAAECAHADVLEGRTSPCGVRDRADMECPANETGGVLWSCNMAVKKDAFLHLDGFDEGFPFPAFEDMDFHFRLLDAKKVVKFVPAARVLHPWRIARGADFIRAMAASGARFRARHPTRVPPRGLFRKSEMTLRFLVKRWIPEAIQFRGKGSARSLYLHLVLMRDAS